MGGLDFSFYNWDLVSCVPRGERIMRGVDMETPC